MSRYKKFDFSSIKGYSLYDRHSKVSIDDFARIPSSDSINGFLDSLPRLLAAEQLRLLAGKIIDAASKGKPIIWAFGGHVIKTGLAPVIIDLMERGFVGALATNGSGVIHDFEIALCGRTSEDVDVQLGPGLFGMAEETGELMNRAISQGASRGMGIGESLGEFLETISPEHPEVSITLQAFQRKIPLTVHSALGTDIIHMHPEASGEALGGASLLDFKIFTEVVSTMNRGGVYLNIGSAVILPEVFLKAVSVVRSTGRELEEFTTANLDFIQHYRPMQNVIKRPVLKSGTGITLTGHHEIMIPLLAACLRSAD
jgi:hypothetical protein